MKWINWRGSSQSIARRLLWLALLIGLVSGAAVGLAIALGAVYY